ncbi:aminoacyl-tRNA hydrolase [Bachmanniomyces sp. S44760]|nr:aminoacyl-tRNA hydrolase [Bachmanniomyces sp. S44760]
MAALTLVASLGNPGSTYANTFHSAGHTVLSALQEKLRYPNFGSDRSKSKGTKGISTHGDEFALWQSQSFMNVSGPAVATGWKDFLRGVNFEDRPQAKLVVVHDELELPLGKVNVKKGGSAKGHNGIKSCIEKLNGMEFTRIGVGIGRPMSRDPDDVAKYVLKKMTSAEIGKVRGTVEEVLDILREINLE